MFPGYKADQKLHRANVYINCVYPIRLRVFKYENLLILDYTRKVRATICRVLTANYIQFAPTQLNSEELNLCVALINDDNRLFGFRSQTTRGDSEMLHHRRCTAYFTHTHTHTYILHIHTYVPHIHFFFFSSFLFSSFYYYFFFEN